MSPEFPGFTGTSCNNCNALVNVLFGGSWNCPNCNSFNGEPRERLPLHKKPDCGNTEEEIDVVARAYTLERFWAPLSEETREGILETTFAGILLRVTALRAKPVSEIEKQLDATEFRVFQQLVLATQS